MANFFQLDLAGITDLYFGAQYDLGGVTFLFDFIFDTRDGYWYYNLFDANELPIQLGRKLVPDWPLWRNVIDSRLPGGMLWAIDTSGASLPAGQADLGDRVQMVWWDGTP